MAREMDDDEQPTHTKGLRQLVGKGACQPYGYRVDAQVMEDNQAG